AYHGYTRLSATSHRSPEIAMKLLLPAILLLLLAGCPPTTVGTALHADIAATGTAMDKASAYISSADFAAKAVKPHADATGAALLGQVSKSHEEAQGQLAVGKTQLAGADARANQLETQLKVAQS